MALYVCSRRSYNFSGCRYVRLNLTHPGMIRTYVRYIFSRKIWLAWWLHSVSLVHLSMTVMSTEKFNGVIEPNKKYSDGNLDENIEPKTVKFNGVMEPNKKYSDGNLDENIETIVLPALQDDLWNVFEEPPNEKLKNNRKHSHKLQPIEGSWRNITNENFEAVLIAFGCTPLVATMVLR